MYIYRHMYLYICVCTSRETGHLASERHPPLYLSFFHGFIYSIIYYLSPWEPPMESRACPRGAPSLLINMRVPDLHEGYLRKGIRHLHLCLMLVFTQRPLYSTVKKTHGMFCNFLFHTQHQESTI